MSSKKKVDKIKFHYLKTPSYRAYHVDGIFGGITPNLGNIHIELFVERNPIPLDTTYGIDENGKLTKNLISQNTKKGVIRNIECGLVMNIPTAKTLSAWLIEKINNYEKINKEITKKVNIKKKGENKDE